MRKTIFTWKGTAREWFACSFCEMFGMITDEAGDLYCEHCEMYQA